MISYYLLYHMFDFKLYYLLYPYQMQQLDAETREVIHLRLAGDFSFRDIGDILGHSEVWARVRFYRGKEKLVKIIGGDNNA